MSTVVLIPSSTDSTTVVPLLNVVFDFEERAGHTAANALIIPTTKTIRNTHTTAP